MTEREGLDVPADDGSICSGWGSDISLPSEDGEINSPLQREMERLHAQQHVMRRTLEALRAEQDELIRKVRFLEAKHQGFQTVAKLVTVAFVGIIQVFLPYLLLTSRSWFVVHEQTLLPLFGSAKACTVLVFLLLRIVFLLSWKTLIGEERNLIRDTRLLSLVLLSIVPLGPRMAMIAFSTISMGLTIGVLALDKIHELDQSGKKDADCSSVRTVSNTLIRWVCWYTSCEEQIVTSGYTVFLLLLNFAWRTHSWVFFNAPSQRFDIFSVERWAKYGCCVAVVVLSIHQTPFGALLRTVFLTATGLLELFSRLPLRDTLCLERQEAQKQVRVEPHAPRPNRSLRSKKTQ